MPHHLCVTKDKYERRACSSENLSAQNNGKMHDLREVHEGEGLA